MTRTPKKKYSFITTPMINTSGVSLSGLPDPQKAGREFEKIQRASETDSIAPRDVWENATAKAHPLHDCFEWDDSVGGSKYRDSQASLLLRTIKVEVHITPVVTKRVQAFVSIQPEADKRTRGYRDVLGVMKNRDDGNFVLNQSLSGLCAWRKRWAELAAVDGTKGAVTYVDQAIAEIQSAIAAG